MPQAHELGAEGEVDFHDLWVVLRGVKTKTALFTMRLSYSGRAAHRAALSQGQEAFLEAHVYAFGRLGGVPARRSATTPDQRGQAGVIGRPGWRTSAGWRSLALRLRRLVLHTRA